MESPQNPYVKIVNETSLCSEGSAHHIGELIDSSCNGYKDIDD
jgi:hypothetical protein